ncbi:MAG TPA: S8 family serine peptidase [Chloroflexia bacterium]|nr:S8 family serine peptidase [Chloroflexia bacterium]
MVEKGLKLSWSGPAWSKVARLAALQLVLTLVALLGLALFPPRAEAAQDTPYVDGQVVVQLLPGVDINLVDSLLGTTVLRVLSFDRTYLLGLPAGQTVSGLLNSLTISTLFSFIEPNYKMFVTEGQQIFIYYDQTQPLNDDGTCPQPQETACNQWAFQAIDLNKSQRLSKGQNVTVAVLDTGTTPNHPLLRGHTLPGYDATLLSGNVTDNNGHGTFVSALVAQVAPSAGILPVKALGDNGEGTVVAAAEGVHYASDHGASVINMSMGLYAPSKLLEMAVNYAQNNGDLVVASAGNDGTADKRYPAAYPNVLSVAAIDQNDQKASFSNYGPNARVSAPGVNVYSAYYKGGFAAGSGTSFAAPQVAGLAAQIWQLNPSWKAGTVNNQVLSYAQSLVKNDPTYGGQLGSGLINNYRSVSASAS